MDWRGRAELQTVLGAVSARGGRLPDHGMTGGRLGRWLGRGFRRGDHVVGRRVRGALVRVRLACLLRSQCSRGCGQQGVDKNSPLHPDLLFVGKGHLTCLDPPGARKFCTRRRCPQVQVETHPR